jgi:hypothetical protein
MTLRWTTVPLRGHLPIHYHCSYQEQVRNSTDIPPYFLFSFVLSTPLGMSVWITAMFQGRGRRYKHAKVEIGRLQHGHDHAHKTIRAIQQTIKPNRHWILFVPLLLRVRGAIQHPSILSQSHHICCPMPNIIWVCKQKQPCQIMSSLRQGPSIQFSALLGHYLSLSLSHTHTHTHSKADRIGMQGSRFIHALFYHSHFHFPLGCLLVSLFFSDS